MKSLNNKPFFSIVIPTYNRATLIGRCLDSVVGQIFTDWEAIIVDNYSSDNTEDVVMSYNDSRIKFVKNHNYGVISVSRNKGIDMAEGQWVCFLDSDDFWKPNKLEEVVKHVNKYQIVYHAMRTYSIGGEVGPIFRGIKLNGDAFHKLVANGDRIGTSTICIRRDIIGDHRFTVDKLMVGTEDYIFWLTIIEHTRNIKVKYIDKPLSYYGVGDNYSIMSEQIKREKIFVSSFKDHLSIDVKRDFLKWFMFRKAGLCFSRKDYDRALKLLKISFGSSSMRMKYKSFTAICHIYFLKVASKLNTKTV